MKLDFVRLRVRYIDTGTLQKINTCILRNHTRDKKKLSSVERANEISQYEKLQSE